MIAREGSFLRRSIVLHLTIHCLLSQRFQFVIPPFYLQLSCVRPTNTSLQDLSTSYPTLACTVYVQTKTNKQEEEYTPAHALDDAYQRSLKPPVPPLPLTSRPSTPTFALFNCAPMSCVGRDLYVKHNSYSL